jgi:hypothetical protein
VCSGYESHERACESAGRAREAVRVAAAPASPQNAIDARGPSVRPTHTVLAFVVYRIVLGTAVLLLVATDLVS